MTARSTPPSTERVASWAGWKRQASGRKVGMVRPGKINHDEMGAWLDEKGVMLRGGDLDEAPQAYRRLPDVLAAQGDTIEVLHTLRPLIVCMAPSRTRPTHENP